MRRPDVNCLVHTPWRNSKSWYSAKLLEKLVPTFTVNPTGPYVAPNFAGTVANWAWLSQEGPGNTLDETTV